jgi:hypothetical protein
MISIFSTSQKYKILPTAFRVVSSMLISFQLSPSEFKAISDELVYSNVDLETTAVNVFGSGKKFLMYNIASGVFYSEFDKIS